MLTQQRFRIASFLPPEASCLSAKLLRLPNFWLCLALVFASIVRPRFSTEQTISKRERGAQQPLHTKQLARNPMSHTSIRLRAYPRTRIPAQPPCREPKHPARRDVGAAPDLTTPVLVGSWCHGGDQSIPPPQVGCKLLPHEFCLKKTRRVCKPSDLLFTRC